ncbi:MAG: CHAT domain-containing protein, partial [Dokdonella sp.]
VTALRAQRPPVRADLRTSDRADDAPAGWLALATAVASLPTLDEIAREASGRGVAIRRAKHRAAPVPIRVAWGDLRHARHAVMVGHYVGDSLISAEAAIDRALGGRLGEAHRLGVYPGEPGTSLAIVDPTATPPGVVVIGLGDIGKLSPGTLGDAVARGVVAWIGGREDQRRRSGDLAQVGGISLLLIGSGEGGVDADTAVYSILRGVREGIDRGQRAGIAATLAEIEFIELHRDRAHRLWHTLDRLLGEGELHEQFVLAGTIIEGGDGRTRLWEAAPSGWWRRLQIAVPQTSDGQPVVDELVFTSLTDSARSEAYRLPFQRALVERLIAESIAGTERDESREKTLFELMLPNELKERAPQRESLVLLLDRSTANLPWELLTDPLERTRSERMDGKPLAIRAGLVRQFATSAFRIRPSVVVDNTALVIGDPKPPVQGFAQLPGAQREARVVAGLLGTNARFHVEHLHRPSGTAVVQTLLPKRFRILHVAGHGMLAESGSDRDAGIVLDAFNLSWASLDQMRAIPELVFINCCHLGRVALGERDQSLSRRNEFAAGVGEVFIRNGARAVIAAGWAVEDNGAEIFASTFYAQMLAGERFGDAVRNARVATYEVEARSNTWAAYQCYGDPDYRLVSRSVAARGDWPAPRYASTEEMITDAIDTIAGGDLDAESRERVRQQIAAFAASASQLEALQRARVQLALARACARSRLHVGAIDHYQQALDLDGDALSLGDLALQAEQFVSAAIEQAGGAGDADAIEQFLDGAIARLQRLLAIRSNDARRLLLARVLQHAAMLRHGDARQQALEQALQHFEEASHGSSSAALLMLLVAWRNGTPPLRTRKRLREQFDPLLTPADDGDDAVLGVLDASLIEILLEGKLQSTQHARLLSCARSARALSTASSRAAVDSLAFVVAMLAEAGSAAGLNLHATLQSTDAALRRGD